MLPLFESGIPLARKKLRALPDADNITIAYPDEGSWKRFHYQFGDYPEVWNKVSFAALMCAHHAKRHPWPTGTLHVHAAIIPSAMTTNLVHLGALRVVRIAPHHMVIITLHITDYIRCHSTWWALHSSLSSCRGA